MLRYRVRTLLIVLAVLPPLLAVCWWRYTAWREEQQAKQTEIIIQISEQRTGRLMFGEDQLDP
jgi:hypothetical protein